MSARTLIAGVLLASTGAAVAGDSYVTHFATVYRDCADRYPPHEISATQDVAAARETCFSEQVAKALANMPPDSPQRLTAALQVAPEYADSTFASALEVGFDPYFAVTAATRALPDQNAKFAALAIGHGADPSQVTEATAAGLRERKD